MRLRTLDDVREWLRATFSGFEAFWAVAGGWALDFYLNRQTREHKDIEVAIWRNDQKLLRKHLKGWELKYLKNGQPFQLEEPVDLPVHEIHGVCASEEIEVLLNEHYNGRWIFRRNQAVSLPTERFSLRSPSGVQVLAPEVVLLYKAKKPTDVDEQDLRNCLPTLNLPRIQWLRSAISTTHPGHPWVAKI